MKTKLIISLVVGIMIGATAHHVWIAQTSTARHWHAVRKYNTHMRDPSNYTPDPQSGLSFTSEPLDPMPHLAALVSAGELNHADIVLPTVPYSNRDATRHWMAFCERHRDEIVYAVGATDPGPIHLNIWYTDAGEKLVSQLVEEVKEIGTGDEPTTN